MPYVRLRRHKFIPTKSRRPVAKKVTYPATVKDLKVSVITPVYNLGKFLPNTIRYLKNQTLKDFEVILVNDGSTDKSEQIIRNNIKDDKRFRLINQRNLGGAAARNNGFRNARGETVIFLDGDDYFTPSLLEMAYNRHRLLGAEVVLFHYLITYGGKNAYGAGGPKAKEFKRVFPAQAVPYRVFHLANPAPWSKLYSRDYLIKIHAHFDEQVKTCNDVYFFYLTMAQAKRIAIVDEALLKYTARRQGSISSKRSSKDAIDCINTCIRAKNDLEKLGLYHHYAHSFVVSFFGYINYHSGFLNSAGRGELINALVPLAREDFFGINRDFRRYTRFRGGSLYGQALVLAKK